jgi:hypothetical protein
MQDRDYAMQALGHRACPRCGETHSKFGHRTTAADRLVVNGVTLLDDDLPSMQCVQSRFYSCESRCFICGERIRKWRWRYVECFPRKLCDACVKSTKGGAK